MLADTPEMNQELRLLEAMIFASSEPLSTESIAQQMGPECNVVALLMELKALYVTRGVNLIEVDGVWCFRTAPDLAPLMKITHKPRRKLPRAAAEVLAVIAYHQPITRGEIEQIRGVETSKGTLDILLELGWVRPGKRKETPGRPLTWNTTTEFLGHFDLESLRDLPGVEDLKAAGLLDARPILSNLPRVDDADNTLLEGIPDQDGEYAAWVDVSVEEVAIG